MTIYCNLRRPDEYLSSWHRQRLKFGAKLGRLSEEAMDEYLGSAHFQQARLIEEWVHDHFPEARLVVRNFKEVRAQGGSILDFIHNSGIGFPAGLHIPRDQNPSVPAAFAEVGRRAIHDLDLALSREVVGWLTSAGRRVAHHPDAQVEVFGRRNRDRLVQAFAPVATSLDRLTGRAPFYPDLQDLEVLRPVSDLQATQDALPDLLQDAKLQELSPSIIKWLDLWSAVDS
ncbi:MAG: hypothetical protein FJX25_17205 [Alphaproteobacteria bacterium]|nr:hypothetical protein [Alphaproteobacteria bacterium]